MRLLLLFFRWLFRRSKPVELEILDSTLNRASAFWWEARSRGDRVTLAQEAPDGLYDVIVIRTFKPGESVTDDLGRVTTFPKGAQQPDLVQGVVPARFKIRKSSHDDH